MYKSPSKWTVVAAFIVAVALHAGAVMWVEMPQEKPANYDLNDFHQEAGLAAVEELLAHPKKHPQRFKLLDRKSVV